MSDRSSHLSPHFDALTPDSIGDSVDMINLSDENYLEILDTFSPRVRRRVEFLIELQKQHDKVQAKYFEERSKLEARYLKLYEPIYKKRHDVVNGLLEVEATDEVDREERGIPNFWLTAMKTNDTLAELITEADEGPLEYLRDIKWCRVEASKSFKLKFFFHPNPYFRNTVLEKTYHMIDEDEPMVMEATGMEILWNKGKCLTRKVLEKMPKKKSNNDMPLTNTEKCKSFFNFFNPPRVPEREDHDDGGTSSNSVPVEEMQKDFDYACVIRDQIIPRAVSWFTGAATL